MWLKENNLYEDLGLYIISTSWPILVLRIDLDPAKCIGTGARNKFLLIFKGSGWEQKWVCEIWSDSRSFESILNSSVRKA